MQQRKKASFSFLDAVLAAAVFLFNFVPSVSAFSPVVSTALKKSPRSLSMTAEDFIGAMPPTGFFDPLGLSAGRSDEEIKLWRESELKHGRLAMLATNGIIMAENFNPLFGGKVTGAAIYHFQQINSMYPIFWVVLVIFIGVFENIQISRGYESFGKGTGPQGAANLKKDYINGDLGNYIFTDETNCSLLTYHSLVGNC